MFAWHAGAVSRFMPSALIVIVGAVDAGVARAQTISGPPASAPDWRESSASEDRESLWVGGQRYAGSVHGLRQYIDTLRTRDAELFRTLDDEVASLEHRRTLAFTVAGVGAAGGLGLGITGFVLGTNDSPGDDARATAFFVSGIALLLSGPLVGALLLPGRGDVLRVIDLHNARSKTPIRWGLAANPASGRWTGVVSGVF